jgi:hypothetical protein
MIRDALAAGSKVDLSMLLDQTILHNRPPLSSSSISTTASASQPVTQPNSATRPYGFPAGAGDSPSPLDSRGDLGLGGRPLDSLIGESPIGVIDFLQKKPTRDPKSQRLREREVREAGLVAIEAGMKKEEEDAERKRLEKENRKLEEEIREMRMRAEAMRIVEAEEERQRVQAVKKEMVDRYEREKREMEERFEREKKELEEKYTPDGRLKIVPKVEPIRKLDIAASRSQDDLRLPLPISPAEALGHNRQRSGSVIDSIMRMRNPATASSPTGSTQFSGLSGSPVSLSRRSTVSSTSTGSTRRNLLPAPVPPPSKPLPALPVSPITQQAPILIAEKIPTKYQRFQAAQTATSSTTASLPLGQTFTLGAPIKREVSPAKPRPVTGTTLAWDRITPDETDAIGRLRVRSDKTASVVSARAFFKDDLREFEALDGEERPGISGPIDEEGEDQEREREMSRIREMDVATPEFLTPLEDVGALDVSQAGPSTVQLEGNQRSGSASLGGLMAGMERMASSASSLHSTGTSTTGAGKRRFRPQTPALDISEWRTRMD